MHNVFHVLLLKQNTIKKERVDKWVTKLELEAGNSNEYKIKAIWDSAIYASKSELGQLLELYYLVAWKGYPKEKNTWEPSFAVQHLKKLINSFYKDQLEKITAIFPLINLLCQWLGQQLGQLYPQTKARSTGRQYQKTSKELSFRYCDI